jgi:ferredoxin
MAPQANPFVEPDKVPADLFFAFWVPIAQRLGGGQALLLAAGLGLALLAVPGISACRGRSAHSSSVVDEDLCVGCLQCAIDCPFGAITMVERVSRRSDLVARVDPGLCVSCGICAASCAPMGVGPPGRNGRDQLADVRQFLAEPGRRDGEVVVICCDHGAGTFASDLRAAGGVPYPIDCAGNLHTSVIEALLREGAGGVLILACPPRDCWHREGPRWLKARVYGGREAELQPRVERARIMIANVAAGERTAAIAILRAFAAEVATLAAPVEAGANDLDGRCEPALAEWER